MKTRKKILKHLWVLAVMGILFCFTASPALSQKPIEVAPGYVLEKVYEGLVPLPTSIAIDYYGNLYASSLGGLIRVLNLKSGKVWDLKTGLISPKGLAFHPTTGLLYVSHQYFADGNSSNQSYRNVKSRISVINPKTGAMSTFVEDLPSMYFEDIPIPIAGSQGMDFDTAGNLYVAQGINDELTYQDGDHRPSSVLKIDPKGNVSVFSSGVRSPYDVVVEEEKGGVAVSLLAGDNGEGEENGYDKTRPSRQYFDKLNRLYQGKHYGWPGGAPGFPAKDHIGPLWNFDKLPYPIGNPSQDIIKDWQWRVPTGIALSRVPWGKVKKPLILCLFGCGSLTPDIKDAGTIEMFSGPNYSDRTTLAQYIYGPIDVFFFRDKLYFAEFGTGTIYRIVPEE